MNIRDYFTTASGSPDWKRIGATALLGLALAPPVTSMAIDVVRDGPGGIMQNYNRAIQEPAMTGEQSAGGCRIVKANTGFSYGIPNPDLHSIECD